MNGIYQQVGSRNWDKPAVYKIRKDGMWWATGRDQEGKFHSDCFHTHWAALSKATEYAAGVYQ